MVCAAGMEKLRTLVVGVE